MKKPRIASAGAIACLFGVFGTFVVYPLGALVAESLHVNGHLSLGNYTVLFDLSNRVNLDAVGNSVAVSILSVLFSGLLGLFLAFVFTQCEFPFKVLLSRLAVLPVALPPLVGVIAFLYVFGESGIIPRGLQILFGTASQPLAAGGIGGVLLVHVYSFHVYYYLFASAALRGLDKSQIEAAAGLGSGAWRTFRRVVLPELRPAILAASALTFMSSMASFTAPLLFAGERHFITLQIYETKLNGDLDLAAAQSVLLTAVSLVFYVILMTGQRKIRQARKGAGPAGVMAVPRGARHAMVAFAIIVLCIEFLPVATIVALSLAREGSWTTQWLPAEYTVDNYMAFLRDPRLLEPVWNSIAMALLAVGASVLFGVTAAFLVTRRRERLSRTGANLLLTMPYAVPGTVVAIALILAFNKPVMFGAVLVGTFWIMPLAYFVREYPLVVRSVSASLERLDDSQLEAAEGLGAGVWRRFRFVAFPAILPGILSGGVLVIIGSLGEFVGSVLLYSYSSRPISVEILAQLRLFNIGAAAAYSVVLMFLILLLVSFAGLVGEARAPSATLDIPLH